MPAGSTAQRPHKRRSASFLCSPIISHYQSSMPSAGGSILLALIAPGMSGSQMDDKSIHLDHIQCSAKPDFLCRAPVQLSICARCIPITDGGKRLELNVTNIGMLYTNKATALASIAHGCQLRRATATIWWLPPQRLPFSDATWESPSPPSLARYKAFSTFICWLNVQPAYRKDVCLTTIFRPPQYHEPPPPRTRMASPTLRVVQALIVVPCPTFLSKSITPLVTTLSNTRKFHSNFWDAVVCVVNSTLISHARSASP
ncbi:hypothetical protein B0H13DRAFT_1855480 [Mycena leptocephala]|nr:hypothetical protein B0H13DRAFT_1855480 [Mycena leptocephala]